MYDNGTIIAFIAVMTFPHPIIKNARRCSRLVVLPDYQGIGIGYKFLSLVAEMYKRQGFSFTIVTSAKNLIYKMHKSKDWNMIRLSVSGKNTGSLKNKSQSDRSKVKTASFRYLGG